MVCINYNDTLFRAQFPEYANTTTYPSALIDLYWGNATAYITNRYQSYTGMNKSQQILALNYLTAHLLAISQMIRKGDQGGIVTGASVDKVSVTLEPPPQMNQWQWWLNQTPYGQQLLALLQIAAAGGRTYTSRPPITQSFR